MQYRRKRALVAKRKSRVTHQNELASILILRDDGLQNVVLCYILEAYQFRVLFLKGA